MRDIQESKYKRNFYFWAGKSKKNVEEGRGISIAGLGKGLRSTSYEFATSNPMWRASLETLDFLPLSTIDYAGGVIVSDWYQDNSASATALKITVRFLSTEIAATNLKIIVHEKKCNKNQVCTTTLLKQSKIKEELVSSIIRKAAVLEKEKLYRTKKDQKFYCLEMFPYPSGKIHMGHVRNYTIGDVIARFKYLNGYNVLHPMGWDSFGLPAENAARENNLHPKKWTEQNISQMKRQLRLLGLSIDWDLEISTCDEDYYKHQQELFIDLYQEGYVSKKENYVNWDPAEQTVLANEQVIDGKGWRSGVTVERKKLSQWVFNITKFANELINDLDSLKDWPEKVKLMQKNWIGKSIGCEIDFQIFNQEEKIKIFTTRPDTIFGASFLAISVDHNLCKEFEKNIDFLKFKEECLKVGTTEEALANAEKNGYNTGLLAKHPFIENKKIPIFVANFVLMDYGTGAIFGCPAHDQRDLDFAKKYNLEVTEVVAENKNKPKDFNKLNEAYTSNGILINSFFLDGLEVEKAKTKIIEKIEEKKIGKKKNIL